MTDITKAILAYCDNSIDCEAVLGQGGATIYLYHPNSGIRAKIELEEQYLTMIEWLGPQKHQKIQYSDPDLFAKSTNSSKTQSPRRRNTPSHMSVTINLIILQAVMKHLTEYCYAPAFENNTAIFLYHRATEKLTAKLVFEEHHITLVRWPSVPGNPYDFIDYSDPDFFARIDQLLHRARNT